MLPDKGVEDKVQRIAVPYGAALRHGRTRAVPCGDGEAAQALSAAAAREGKRDGRPIESVGIAAHRERIDRTIKALVNLREQLPHLIIYRAAAVCTLRANGRPRGIALRKQIVRGKDIRTLGIGRLLPIGGEPHEKVVIVGAALRARKKSAEELTGARIVLPECAEIVLHPVISSGRGNLSPLFPMPSRNARTGG